jgi:hypothetical protein
LGGGEEVQGDTETSIDTHTHTYIHTLDLTSPSIYEEHSGQTQGYLLVTQAIYMRMVPCLCVCVRIRVCVREK